MRKLVSLAVLLLLVAACGDKESDADRRTAAIRARVEQAFSAAALAAASLEKRDFADAGEFHHFAEGFAAAYPVTVLSWAPLVTREGRGDKLILQPAADNKLIPMDEREDYLPVLYQERSDGQPLTLGFDLQAVPDRKATIGQARDAHAPIALQPPRRSFNVNSMPVYSILWPVYRQGTYIGVVAGLAPADRMLDFLMKDAPSIKGRIAVFSRHGEDPAKDVPVMYWKDGKFAASSEALGEPPAGVVRLQRRFSVNDLEWLLVFDYAR